MGGPTKKTKTSSKAKAGKKELKQKEKPKELDEYGRELTTPPQDRVLAVRPFWETQLDEERTSLLQATLPVLRERAQEIAVRQRKQAAIEEAEFAAEIAAGAEPIPGAPIAQEPTMDEVLEEGLARLQTKPTWKRWQWPLSGQEFNDADSFRQFVEEHHIAEHLRRLLPREEGRAVEKPAEAALRKRMADLLQKVHNNTRQLQDDVSYGNKRAAKGPRATPDQINTAVRDTNIELITIMLQAMEEEHEYLYHSVLFPVTAFVCEMLLEGQRESSRAELFFEDLEKMAPTDVARISEWLTERVDSFSAKLKPEAKELLEEEDENGIGDVDLFTMTQSGDGLEVNAKWLQHLQERLLGEDGHPRKVQDSEDPHRMGLVLEWVYGTIVSTAEKARDGAKRTLGVHPPSVQGAHDLLLQALQDQSDWERRARAAKDLLNEMVRSRREAAQLSQQYDIKPVPTLMHVENGSPPEPELPDSVIESMLQRELLLTNAKLHGLANEHSNAERRLRSLRAQLRQGEPGFERLKRELEDLKNAPRGLEGTYRTAAEMERHRAQAADAAIEEQLEVQTAFREHGAKLQGIYEVKQRTETEMTRREQEMKQLSSWRATVTGLADKFARPLVALQPDILSPAAGSGLPDANGHGHSALEAGIEQFIPLNMFESAHRGGAMRPQLLHQHLHERQKNRAQFHKDVRRQLYTDKDDREIFSTIQDQLRRIDKRLEDGRAALQPLEMSLINVACDDPGAAIGAQLVLPLLQERLDAKALEFADRRAVEAEEDIIRMESLKADREKVEREKRNKLKQKKLERLRSEKEKAAAERLESERAAAEAALLEARQVAELEELDRLKREESEKLARKAAEELMEARRNELLSEDGYWSRRMKDDAALLAATTLVETPGEDADSSDHSGITSWPGAAEQRAESSRGSHADQSDSSYGQGQPYMNGHSREQPHSGLNGQARQRFVPDAGRGRGRGRGPPPRRQGGTPPASRPMISRSSSSLSEQSALSETRSERQQRTPAPSLPQHQQAATQTRPQPPPVLAQVKTDALKASGQAHSQPPAAPHLQQHHPQQQHQQQQQQYLQQQQQCSAAAAAAAAAAELPPAPATPAVAHEPEQSSSKAEMEPAEAMQAAQGTQAQPGMLQFGDVPAMQPEVRAPPSSHDMPLPAGSSAPFPDGPHIMQQQQQHAAPLPYRPQSGRLLEPYADHRGPHMGDSGQMSPSGRPYLTGQPRQQPGRPQPRMQPHMGLGPQGMLPGLRGQPSQDILHSSHPVPDGPAMHGRPGSAQHSLPQGPEGMHLVGPQGFAQPPAHLRVAPHQLPLPLQGQMGFPAGARSNPMPLARGHFLPPGSPPGMQQQQQQQQPPPQQQQQQQQQQQRQPLMVPPYMPMSGPQLLGQPVPPPNLGFAPQGRQPGFPGPYVPNGHLPQDLRLLSAAARQELGAGHMTGLRANAPAFVPRGEWGSSDGSRSPSLGLPEQSSMPLPPMASGQRPGPHELLLPKSTSEPLGQQALERAPLQTPAAQADTQEADQPAVSAPTPLSITSDDTGRADATSLDGTSMTHAASQASVGSSAPEHSAPDSSEVSDGTSAPPPESTSQAADASQNEARIRASEPSMASTSRPQQPQRRGRQGWQAEPQPRQTSHVGGLTWEGHLPDLLATRLVRGLRNDSGLNNCFLNVVLQCLWHSPAFRGSVLSLTPADLDACGSTQDAAVLRALRAIFLDLAAPAEQPSQPGGEPASESAQCSAPGRTGADVGSPLHPDALESPDAGSTGALGQAKRARHEADQDAGSARSPRSWTVSPSQLREALSSVDHAAIQFELSEMHDAAEVLGEVFASLHRAQLGPSADSEPDVQLPQRIRVPHGQQALRPPQSTLTATLVLAMFGQAVQADAPPPGGSRDVQGSRRARGSPKAAVGQWQEVPTRSGSPLAPVANGHPRLEAPEKPFHGTELLQYTKFSHLVPARGLLQAHEHLPGASFEELLCEADAAGQPKRAPGANARMLPVSLLHAPHVFVLALVWESPQASSSTIAATVDSLSEQLDLGRMFRSAPQGASYSLRGIICYFSHHYQALVQSEELGQWLLFDDTAVKQLGSWGEVQAAMVAARMQPSLLFFERV